MLQLAGHLEHGEPGAQHVDGEGGLDAPAAGERRPASKAAGLRQRMPESGCTARKPVRCSMPRRARPTTRPRPPPAVICAGRVAMVMSALPSSTAVVSTPRLVAVSCEVAVDEEQGRGPGGGRVGHGIRLLELAHPAHPGLERGGLAAVARVAHDVGAGGAGGRRAVPSVTAVVDHDDPADLGQGGHGRGTVAAMRSASSLQGTTAATRAASALISGG